MNNSPGFLRIFRVETVDGSAVSVHDFIPFNQVIEFQPKEVEKEVRIVFSLIIRFYFINSFVIFG